MKSDKDIELEIMNKAKKIFDEIWGNKEEILQNLYEREKSAKKIKFAKRRIRELQNEIKAIRHKQKKALGITARLDEELDVEFDQVNGIKHFSKIELGIKALTK